MQNTLGPLPAAMLSGSIYQHCIEHTYSSHNDLALQPQLLARNKQVDKNTKA